MFQPVSAIEYVVLEPTAQALLVATPPVGSEVALRTRWGKSICAVLSDANITSLDAVIRDLLANPQIRAIVFDGPVCHRDRWSTFWGGNNAEFPVENWGIEPEHLELVRRFVDLYDDTFTAKGWLQAYWPARIRYFDKPTQEP